MERTETSGQPALSEIARSLHTRNQRYLDMLKQSGDPSDATCRVLATILDCVADGLIVLDENLTIVMANTYAAKIAGWELEDLTRDELRRNYKIFYDDEGTPVPHEEEPIVVAMREKRPYEVELYAESPHLEPGGRWFRSHAAPVLDESGQPIGGVTIFSDISERLRLERERDCLVALISHDIKNHFAAEQISLDLLLHHEADKFDAKTLQLLTSLRAASEKFVGIANSLLEMSRSRFFSGAEYGQEVDLATLVEAAIKFSDLVAADRHVQVAVSCAPECPTVRGLPAVIRHVLHNIILNAIEVSPKDSQVKVSISSDSAYVSVNITDVGEGMSSEEVSQIFSPHRVAGHISKTTHSTGFGLYFERYAYRRSGRADEV